MLDRIPRLGRGSLKFAFLGVSYITGVDRSDLFDARTRPGFGQNRYRQIATLDPWRSNQPSFRACQNCYGCLRITRSLN